VEIRTAGVLRNHKVIRQGKPSNKAMTKISMGCRFKNLVNSTTDLVWLPLREVLTKRYTTGIKTKNKSIIANHPTDSLRLLDFVKATNNNIITLRIVGLVNLEIVWAT
jgi:hypothetical protein